MLDRAQILRVHDVGAMLVFHHRHQLPRSLAFLDQINLIGCRVTFYGSVAERNGFSRLECFIEIKVDFLWQFDIATGIFFSGLDLVIPAAGIGAGTLIGVAMVEIAGQQASSGVGDT